MLMSSVLLTLLVQLATSGLTAQATEPSCAHVADFDSCPGNAHGFCPRGIACGCKDQMPFCKCPTYQSGWEDYWYMGPKCDQLWSTLDLILVAAVPAVALAFVAGVIMQWISYCRSKPRYSTGVSSTYTRSPTPRPQVHYNPANVPNLADNSRSIPQQNGKKVQDDGAAQNIRFPRLAVQSHIYDQPPLSASVGSFGYIPRQHALPVEPGPHVNHPGLWRSEIPDADYGDENPFSAMQMQRFPKAVPSGFPRYN